MNGTKAGTPTPLPPTLNQHLKRFSEREVSRQMMGRFNVAFSLMSVIPLVTCCYLITVIFYSVSILEGMNGVYFLLALLIVYYNYRHRSDPWSPLIMALCRAMVYLIAAALASSALQAPVLVGAALLAAFLIGLTYVAKQEHLEQFRNSWPLVFLAAPFIAYLRELPIPSLAGFVWVAFLGWVLFAISFLYRKRGKNIPRTVITLIAGVSHLDALAIASIDAEPGIVAAAVVGFLLTLAFQRFVPSM